MRVGNESIYRSMTSDLLRLMESQYETQKALATGHNVNAPSDAPSYSVTILDSQNMLDAVDQYRTNLEEASDWMTASESSMQSIVDLLRRAKTLAEQMATGTIQSEEYQSTATEVENIMAQIITLANSDIEGNYIYGGTRTETAPITSTLSAADPGELTTDSSSGHGVVASIYNPAAGDYRLQLTRDTTGTDATVTITSSTLGDTPGPPPIDFTNWKHITAAASGSADTYRTQDSVATATTDISSLAGEELVFTGDSDVGQQTYRTDATIDFPGAGPYNITIGADVYTNVGSAAELVEAVNGAGSADYFAMLEDTDTVRVVSKGTGSFAIVGGGTTVTQNTTLTDLQDDLNSGMTAEGAVNIDATDAAFPPADGDTVTLGDYSWSWLEIADGATLTTALDYANALSSYIEANTDEFSASTTSYSEAGPPVVDGATVLISARATGTAGNVSLSATGASVTTSGGLYGGLDGTDTASEGQLYISGTSDLRLATEVQATVLSVDDTTGAVDLRLRWYDDDGTLHEQDATLSSDGEDNGQSITGSGGLSIYRNGQGFQAGAVYTIAVSHYQGNTEDLAINFNEGGRLVQNWNGEDVLGGASRQFLLGDTAIVKNATGTGEVHLAGTYDGLKDRDITIEVTDAGQVPGDDVTLQVSWTDDSGTAHEKEVTLTGTGLDNAVTVSGCDGVQVYLDSGTYDLGDSHYYKIEQEPMHVLDTLSQWLYQLQNGSDEEAQTQSQISLDSLSSAMESLLDSVATAGTRANRITVRQSVLSEHETYATGQIEDLQDVNLTEAFLKLRNQQTAYTTTLKAISMAGDMSLVNLI